MLVQDLSNTEWVKSSSYSLVNDREQAIFDMGKEKGEEDYKQKVTDDFYLNFTLSYNNTTRVIEKLKGYNIQIISARLRIEPFAYKVLLSLIPSDELTKHISDVYDFLFDLEQEVNTDNYHIDFSILKAGEGFSEELVENDGYVFLHRLPLNEKATRPA